MMALLKRLAAGVARVSSFGASVFEEKAPLLIEGFRTVVGAEDIEVDVVATRAITCLEAPAHTFVLRLAREGIGGVVIDGSTQDAIEGSCTNLRRVVLQSYAIERGVHDIGTEGHRTLTEVTAPVLVSWRQMEGQVGIVPVQPVVGEIEGKGHGDTIYADIQVGINAIAHGGGITRPP